MNSARSGDDAPRWTIETASRLHFGLLAFNVTDRRRQYGGVGMMIQRPGCRLSATRAESFRCEGPLTQRVTEFAKCFAAAHQLQYPPACAVRVERAAAEHAGLGSGTQLGLAVATLLWQREFGMHADGGQQPPATELASFVGRGLRSSVGTHGFDHGGLIYERGKLPDEPYGELVAQVTLPTSWRVVLWAPTRAEGLSGSAEQNAFESMPTVAPNVTTKLMRIAGEQIVPAARAADLKSMGDAIYRYGRLAGSCFASQQGGPFASQQLERWVEAVRARGVTGVGQSSWGPSLFAILESEAAANEFLQWLKQDVTRGADLQSWISPVAHQATRISREPGPPSRR